jgi:hypothetical protein
VRGRSLLIGAHFADVPEQFHSLAVESACRRCVLKKEEGLRSEQVIPTPEMILRAAAEQVIGTLARE